MSLQVVELELTVTDGKFVDWTEGVDVRDEVASEVEFNECEPDISGWGCVFVEVMPDADSGTEGLAADVIPGDDPEAVNDAVAGASTVSTAKVLPLESTSICCR